MRQMFKIHLSKNERPHGSVSLSVASGLVSGSSPGLTVSFSMYNSPRTILELTVFILSVSSAHKILNHEVGSNKFKRLATCLKCFIECSFSDHLIRLQDRFVR